MNAIILEGMVGEPIPYLLRSDWLVTCVLFFCLFICCSVFSKGGKYWFLVFRNFTQIRERNSMFDEISSYSTHHFFLLVFHACLMVGLCLYYYWVDANSVLFEKVSHGFLLMGFVGEVIVLLLLKWILYQIVNWTFFQKVRNLLWLRAYFHLLAGIGLLLLPVFLLAVYFDLSLKVSFVFIAFLLVFAKTVLFWKCFSNFFGKFYGSFHLILYFCALEILPDLLWWKGIEWMNNNLILKIIEP